MSVRTDDQLILLLNGCKQDGRESQKQLYRLFYGYAMSICVRYVRTNEEAMEVMNDGFMKVFTHLKRYEPEKYNPLPSFKGWLRRIMINTALDHYRANSQQYQQRTLAEASLEPASTGSDYALNSLAYEDLVAMVQQLSPVYRTVFNLYVVDGFSHEEIAGQLGISVGTSKSNLSKARANLREMLKKTDEDTYARTIG